jgi:hypothetical protein
MRPSVGYKYQVLQTVLGDSERVPGQLCRPTNLSMKVGNPWNTATTQEGSKTSMTAEVSCKWLAMGNAPGSLDYGHNPTHLASIVNFSPTHFNKPWSDTPISG